MSAIRYVIEFNGVIPLADIADALHGKGLHIRTDGRGVMVVDPVPRNLRADLKVVAPATAAKGRR